LQCMNHKEQKSALYLPNGVPAFLRAFYAIESGHS
jgi:hypothetical protein